LLDFQDYWVPCQDRIAKDLFERRDLQSLSPVRMGHASIPGKPIACIQAPQFLEGHRV